MKEQIQKLRAEGLGYKKIAKILGCSRSLVVYHSDINGKDKLNKRMRQRRKKLHPYKVKLTKFTENMKKKERKDSIWKQPTRHKIYMKILRFQNDNRKVHMSLKEFTVDDIINKFGENPKCYLTGEDIDIYKPNTYHFDHIIPRSKGGPSTIDNLGICTKQANQAKTNMTPDELIQFCKNVLSYNGYEVTSLKK